jgi:hypothetical protein
MQEAGCDAHVLQMCGHQEVTKEEGAAAELPPSLAPYGNRKGAKRQGQ